MKVPTQTYLGATLYSRARRGYSLLEVLLVLGIVITLTLVTLPIGLRFFRLERLDGAAHAVASELARAEANAFYGRAGSAWGIHFFPHQYVLFSGASYDSRSTVYDEVYPLEDQTLSGSSDEIIFLQGSGVTLSPQDIILQSQRDHLFIRVSAQGVINVE